jgi:hypothetical protein
LEKVHALEQFHRDPYFWVAKTLSPGMRSKLYRLKVLRHTPQDGKQVLKNL